MATYDYVIVGGGMTADAAVRGIREQDSRGSIGLFGAETHPPYNRPPLTKGLWKGDQPDSIWRGTPDAGVDLHLGRRVVALDPAKKRVQDDRKQWHGFGKLLLATGGTPRRLPDSPDGVIYYRTLDDYRRVRELADQSAGFVVIGGGFIGSEIAAALRMQGREVTMIMPEPGICARMFPGDLTHAVTEYYGEKGVLIHAGESVKSIVADGKRLEVRTGTGRKVAAEGVIAGLGITPNQELAERAGLAVDDGILVDDRLRTGNPDILAAGDVARFTNPALGRQLRVEHEDNANTMGTVAGRNMAGADAPYHHLPSFYSDLFDLGYEAVGEIDARHETVADWKEPFRQGVVYYLDKGKVRGVLLWNVWGKVDAARALINEGTTRRSDSLKDLIDMT